MTESEFIRDGRVLMICDNWAGAEVYEIEPAGDYVYWPYGGTA